jgi:hypothetical protein
MEALVEDRVVEWIRAVGCEPKPQKDPNALWHMQFDYPTRSGQLMGVVAPIANPRAVIIATGLQTSPEHLQAFASLEDDGKKDFLWELRRALNRIETDFMAEGATSPLECPKRIQISVVKYDDGLTLDSFAHAMGAVYKTKLAVIWTFQEHLDAEGNSPGRRFDFKRFGF